MGKVVDRRHEAVHPESKLPALTAIGAVMILQWFAKDTFSIDVLRCAQWPVLAIEFLILIALFATANHGRPPLPVERWMVIGLSGLLALINLGSAGVLVWDIIDGKHNDVTNNAAALLGTGAAIFATNTIVFAIWYWQLDRGGPYQRWLEVVHPEVPREGRWHFLFTQDAADTDVIEKIEARTWHPRFFDYLYLSVTNVAAFSPTDTMPLTRTAKALMTAESLIALSTLAVVLARAVNVVDAKSPLPAHALPHPDSWP